MLCNAGSEAVDFLLYRIRLDPTLQQCGKVENNNNNKFSFEFSGKEKIVQCSLLVETKTGHKLLLTQLNKQNFDPSLTHHLSSFMEATKRGARKQTTTRTVRKKHLQKNKFRIFKKDDKVNISTSAALANPYFPEEKKIR